jgi:hypothetical protein
MLTLLVDVACENHAKINHVLIVSGAQAGLDKLAKYYDKAPPIFLAAAFMDPRLKMTYFVENVWDFGVAIMDAFQGTGENLISGRVRPA